MSILGLIFHSCLSMGASKSFLQVNLPNLKLSVVGKLSHSLQHDQEEPTIQKFNSGEVTSGKGHVGKPGDSSKCEGLKPYCILPVVVCPLNLSL